MDNTKPEAQQKLFSETEITSDSTSAQQQTHSSSGAYPAALQTTRLSDTPSRSQTSSPQPRRPETETLSAETSADFASRHERMPSVNSLPPKEGQFGVVSSSGQLVCAFRPTPGTDQGSTSHAPEDKVIGTYWSNSGHEAASAESASPPPQISIRQEAAPSSSPPPGGRTASTLELAVEFDSYPEVYVPEEEEEEVEEVEEQQQPPTTSPPRNSPPISPPIPRKSLPMDDSIPARPPAPAYSTPADYQQIGYSGTLDMSTAVATVTPLHMLGDQPDTVDCPFCMRRVETSVKKAASKMTQ